MAGAARAGLGRGRPGYDSGMSERESQSPGRCPHCGAEMATVTLDLAHTPDETAGADLERASLQPGQMVQRDVCTNPDCPTHAEGDGAMAPDASTGGGVELGATPPGEGSTFEPEEDPEGHR